MPRLFVGPLNSFRNFFSLRLRAKTHKVLQWNTSIVWKRDWNIKLTSQKRHTHESMALFRDENQYLIMQLSIRKLLSVCSSLNRRVTFCRANKAVNWHSRLLLFDLWTENNHLFSDFKSQITGIKWNVLIYGVHMRIALSLDIIKTEGDRRANWKRNEIQLWESELSRTTHNVYSTYLHIIVQPQSIQYQSPLKDFSRPFTSISRWFRSILLKQISLRGNAAREKEEGKKDFAYAIASMSR